MIASRLPAFAVFLTSLGFGLVALTACPNGDVGAPCNHATTSPPQSRLVTFPALSCDDLLCVYGESQTVPTTACTVDEDCNSGDPIKQPFECFSPGDGGANFCRLSLEYVLERSMCSKRCDSDADCENSGITSDKKPVAKETKCETGFRCVRIQSIGEFCCQKLCVCDDDLGDTSELDTDCGEPVNGVYAFCEENEGDPTTGM
jgi:hypothetical protein